MANWETRNPRVCLGGIYALEGVARDSEADHPQVMEVLTAYVRAEVPVQEGVRKHVPWKDDWAARGQVQLPNEVQAVLAVLGRRRASWDKHRLDLRRVRLRGVKLPKEADLRGAILAGARLEEAHLAGVNFAPRQFLEEAGPAEAELMHAHLEGANLREANLRGAKLMCANLTNAHL